MAPTPDIGGWIFLTVMRLFVGAGVSGLFAVDLRLVQEFVPTRKRGWVGGVVACCLPLGSVLAARLGRLCGALCGLARPFRDRAPPGLSDASDPLLGAGVSQMAHAHGQTRRGAPVACLGIGDRPCRDQLPTAAGEGKKMPYRELFKHPRSMAVTVLSSLGTQAQGPLRTPGL
jgi:MFS transporter, putative metabolite:H+ symporter